MNVDTLIGIGSAIVALWIIVKLEQMSQRARKPWTLLDDPGRESVARQWAELKGFDLVKHDGKCDATLVVHTTAEVHIDGDTLHLRKGDRVSFTNRSSRPHLTLDARTPT